MLDLTIQEFDGEPRMRDLDIAQALGFDRPRNIRKLIQSNMDDILSFGVCSTVKQTSGESGGRPTEVYWLNEEQALFLCTRSEAKGAVALTKHMVMVFAAWRRGQLPPLEGRDPAPLGDLHPDAQLWCRMIREARMLFGRDRARWLWHQSPLPQLPDYVADDGGGASEPQEIVLQFLRSTIDVTGDKRDFVTSRQVLDAFAAWAAPLGYVVGERAVSSAMKAIAQGYRDPATGAGFTSHKRSVPGYLGLRVPHGAIEQE